MTTTLHATPYNIDATGFYFTDMDDYQAKAKCHLDAYSNVVEEFSLEFINGDNAELFNACGIDQANLNKWFEQIEFLQDHEKISLFYLLSNGYNLETALDKIEEPCISQSTLEDAATELFDECYANEIPDNIKAYIAYDKFARDCELGGDMTEFEYNGTTYTCTNASGI